MEFSQDIFAERLKFAIEQNDQYRRNITGLSSDAGLGRKTVSNYLNNATPAHEKKGMGLYNVMRLAQKLGTTVAFLSGETDVVSPERAAENSAALHAHAFDAIANQTRTDRPTSSDRLIRLHRSSGGQIEAFSELLELCDQYEPPKAGDTRPKLMRVGQRSLSTITLGKPDLKAMQEAFDKYGAEQTSAESDDDDARAKRQELLETVEDYDRAMRRGPYCDYVERDVSMPNMPKRVKVDIIRTLLPVTSRDGQQSLLLFASLLV